MDDILQLHGVATARALSGWEAIERTRHGEFDLIVMDVNMPGIDGIDAFAALKLNGLAAKVLFVTARQDDPRVARAIRDGAIGVLYKPLDPRRLLDVVRRETGAAAPVVGRAPTLLPYEDT